MTADFGAALISELERMIAAEVTIDHFGIQIRVSELCPPGRVYVMDPTALPDFLQADGDPDRVLVVPTEALAEQARKAAEEVGMKVL
jgi:hypothetical protein